MTDATSAQFEKLVAVAYQHLYDLVWLRTSPLIDMLADGPGVRATKEEAWQLHHLLLATIEELAPEPHLPTTSREWRRYQLMTLRFVDALDVDAVAADLGISRREYFREQRRALASVTLLLQERLAGNGSASAPEGDASSRQEGDRQALLQAEATRVSGSERTADLVAVVRDAAMLLDDVARERRVAIQWDCLPDVASVSVEPNLLRQLIMASLGYMIERGRDTTLHIAITVRASAFSVSLSAPLSAEPDDLSCAEMRERRVLLGEMEALTGCDVTVSEGEDGTVAVSIVLPASSRPLVLVVDDNLDVLELMKRYLSSDYVVATAQSAVKAWDLIHCLHPSAITLDLMMPEQDGWDLLQRLANAPELCNIPVVVCSVLKQRSLALAMGASAFVEKPVTEQGIVGVLSHLAEAVN